MLKYLVKFRNYFQNKSLIFIFSGKIKSPKSNSTGKNGVEYATHAWSGAGAVFSGLISYGGVSLERFIWNLGFHNFIKILVYSSTV